MELNQIKSNETEWNQIKNSFQLVSKSRFNSNQIKSNQSKKISSKSKFEWHQLINLNNSNQIASNKIKMNQIVPKQIKLYKIK